MPSKWVAEVAWESGENLGLTSSLSAVSPPIRLINPHLSPDFVNAGIDFGDSFGPEMESLGCWWSVMFVCERKETRLYGCAGKKWVKGCTKQKVGEGDKKYRKRWTEGPKKRWDFSIGSVSWSLSRQCDAEKLSSYTIAVNFVSRLFSSKCWLPW